jgi:hypothetical protein
MDIRKRETGPSEPAANKKHWTCEVPAVGIGLHNKAENEEAQAE